MTFFANLLFGLAILVFLVVVGMAIGSHLKAREATRGKLVEYWLSKASGLAAAIAAFNSHLSLERGYFSSYSMQEWGDRYRRLFDESNDIGIDRLGLPPALERSIGEFRSLYLSADDLRKGFNARFVSEEIARFRELFNNIEGRKLDDQQCRAIVTDEDNNLVIAGAGSGKTTTIVGKVAYVIRRYKILPEEILLISFTNRSASTLAGRIKNIGLAGRINNIGPEARIDTIGLEAWTFHKFGMDIIATSEQKQPALFDELQLKPLIAGFFAELLHNPSYLNKVTTYFTDFFKPIRSQDEFSNQGAYIQYLKDQNFSTYKVRSAAAQGQKTVTSEVVKSVEECRIADFLFFNGIEYDYEYPYPHDTATQGRRQHDTAMQGHRQNDTATKAHRQYKPDFTLNRSLRPVYLEHFAINKVGKVPGFFAHTEKRQTVEQATKEYIDGMNWKRELHKEHETILIETYSYEMSDDTLFANLTRNLNLAGVELHPMTPEEIWKIITETAKDEVDDLITLFQTFITLLKSNNHSISEIANKNKRAPDKSQQKRNLLFLELVTPIFTKYQNYLAARKEIDFSDVINKAAGYILEGKFERNIRYVIIDEFQDLSIGRYQLIKAIKQMHPACKLFCVGDDWQSIYRFTGSDIALFKEFEKYFGYTERSKLETTYRFQTPLLHLSNHFIRKNPNQTKKELKGAENGKSTLYRIVYVVPDDLDDSPALQKLFDEILLGDNHHKEILLLGRYSFDLERIKNRTIFQIDTEDSTITYAIRSPDGEIRRLKAKFMTVHKAKGLEADIVIVLNCNSGKHGFPSGIADDPVLNLLLSESDPFENGEERRLFYVAMTRAKDIVYFLADSANKSKFIAELEAENGKSAVNKCPRCKTADLVLRTKGKAITGVPFRFYGCSNYLYGCTFTKTVYES